MGSLDCINVLFRFSVNVNSYDNIQKIVFYFVVMNGYIDIVLCLICGGINFSIRDEENKMVMDYDEIGRLNEILIKMFKV